MRALLALAMASAIALPACAQEMLQSPEPPREATPNKPACYPYAELKKGLKKDFNETPFITGLLDSGQVFKVFRSPDGSTFSAVAVSPDGKACIVGPGRHLEVTIDLPGIPV